MCIRDRTSTDSISATEMLRVSISVILPKEELLPLRTPSTYIAVPKAALPADEPPSRREKIDVYKRQLLNLGDAHELILYVPFYQQPDVAAQCRSHRLYLLSEDPAFSGTWFQISAQDVDGRGDVYKRQTFINAVHPDSCL